MDEIIAHLHTATKSLYDRGQTVLQQATALATSAAAQTDAPTRAKINSTANAICLKARSVHVDSLSLKKEVQGHETWYPTQATFEFRLWRLMDAVGYALAAEASATAVLGAASTASVWPTTRSPAGDRSNTCSRPSQRTITRRRRGSIIRLSDILSRRGPCAVGCSMPRRRAP